MTKNSSLWFFFNLLRPARTPAACEPQGPPQGQAGNPTRSTMDKHQEQGNGRHRALPEASRQRNPRQRLGTRQRSHRLRNQGRREGRNRISYLQDYRKRQRRIPRREAQLRIGGARGNRVPRREPRQYRLHRRARSPAHAGHRRKPSSHPPLQEMHEPRPHLK